MDELIRYVPALRRLRSHETILEIGSGATGICSYTRRRIHAIDPLLAGPGVHPRIIPVGTDFFDNALPDASYDLVIAIDFLEHVPREMRARAIGEMLRVARRTLVLGCPCGERAHASDARWHAEYARRGETPPDWLDEHIRFGLPRPEEIIPIVEARGVRFESFWNAGVRFHTFFARMAHTPGLRRAKRLAEQLAARVYPLVDFAANIEHDKYRMFVVAEK